MLSYVSCALPLPFPAASIQTAWPISWGPKLSAVPRLVIGLFLTQMITSAPITWAESSTRCLRGEECVMASSNYLTSHTCPRSTSQSSLMMSSSGSLDLGMVVNLWSLCDMLSSVSLWSSHVLWWFLALSLLACEQALRVPFGFVPPAPTEPNGQCLNVSTLEYGVSRYLFPYSAL